MSSADELFLNGQIRPMSPLSIAQFQWQKREENKSSHHHHHRILELEDFENKEVETPSIETTPSSSASFSRSSLPERNSKKDEKGKNRKKTETQKQKRSKQVLPKKSIAGKPANGVGKRRVLPSAHELHYTANRAQLYKTQYNVTLVSSDGDIVAHKTLPLRVSETSSSKQSDDEGLISPHESHFHFNFPNSKTKSQPFLPYHASTSKQGENHPTMSESSSKNKTLSDDHNISSAGFSEVNLVMRMPLQLSWEMVKEITSGFTRMTCFEENENFKTYCGYLSDHHSQVLVRRFTGQLGCVLKAAKKAALSMHHKNILGLSGYYKSKNGTVLVYLFTQRWTLDRFLHDSMGKQWTKMTFQEKMKIAIGICDGVRYMHEECPRGPVVCGDLRSCNIFMNFDLEPQARPLLLQRAFHKLLDKDMEDLDIYEIFRIISVLKGETSCAMQLSPSSEGSPNMDFSGSSICRLVCNLTSELSLSE
ncbi:unnamed protein product [Camellia sinensis]